MLDGDPVMVIRVSRYGRDGLKVSFEGLAQEKKGQPNRMNACFKGERHLYAITGNTVYCCSETFTITAGPFLEQISKEREGYVLIGQKDIPLFYERVVKHISPYSRLILEQVDFGEYEP